MPGYIHGDTREYGKYPREFAWMWMISRIELGFRMEFNEFKTLFMI